MQYAERKGEVKERCILHGPFADALAGETTLIGITLPRRVDVLLAGIKSEVLHFGKVGDDCARPASNIQNSLAWSYTDVLIQ